MKTSPAVSLNAAGSLRKFLNLGLGYSKTPFTFLLPMNVILNFKLLNGIC